MKTAMKLISALLTLALVLCLFAGCDTTGKPTEPAKTEPAATEPAKTEPANTEPAATGEEDTFRFTRENFPRLDGSTSLVPLGEAVASVLLGESREDVQDLVQFNRTTQSFRNLMNGECDLLLASEPNAAVFDEMAEAGFQIHMEQITTEALVFLVNESNPVDGLTTAQLRDIFSGKITNWKELGGNDEEIAAFQRNEGAGSQVLMKKLVMQDIPMAEAPADYMIGSMGELIDAVKSYDNSANAIGYSVYYYAHDMEMAKGLKLLKIDGVAPEKETIRSGAYPFRNGYFTAISAAEPADSPARILFDWLLSEDGQRLADREGYVSVLPVN